MPLLIDSPGLKAAGEGERSTRKHGASRPRPWRKVHLGIDADTMEVRAIDGEQASATGPRTPANGSRVGDGPMLPELLAQIPPEEVIGLVTANGARDTRPCHAAVAARQASAVIPTRRNGRPWTETTPGAPERNEALQATRHLGRAIWRNRSGTRRQSRVEAKRRCLKLLRERLMARTFDRQTAKLPIRAALLNRFARLGTPKTQRVAQH